MSEETKNNGGTISIPINLVMQSATDGEIGAQSGMSANTDAEQNEPLQTAQKAKDKAKSEANAAVAIVTQMASKAANLALNNYGNITGDYVTQANVQAGVSEVGQIVAAAKLGVAGMAIYGAGKAIQAYSYISQIKKSETESNFSKQRVYGMENRS